MRVVAIPGISGISGGVKRWCVNRVGRWPSPPLSHEKAEGTTPGADRLPEGIPVQVDGRRHGLDAATDGVAGHALQPCAPRARVTEGQDALATSSDLTPYYNFKHQGHPPHTKVRTLGL